MRCTESPAARTDPDATPNPEAVTEYSYRHAGNLRVNRAKAEGGLKRATG